MMADAMPEAAASAETAFFSFACDDATAVDVTVVEVPPLLLVVVVVVEEGMGLDWEDLV